jgi:hypothetical protein
MKPWLSNLNYNLTSKIRHLLFGLDRPELFLLYAVSMSLLHHKLSNAFLQLSYKYF